ARAEIATGPHEHDRYTVFVRVSGDCDRIDVVSARARDGLARLDLLQGGALVAEARGPLELELGRGAFHAVAEIGDDLAVAPVEHAHCVGDVARVVLVRDQPYAGPCTALDLVLQTRPRTVCEERVLARADAEQLLEQQQRLARRDRARVR